MKKPIGINFENEIIQFFKANQRPGESLSKTVNRLLKEQFINTSGKQFKDDYSKNVELLVTVLLKYVDHLLISRQTEYLSFHEGFRLVVEEMNLPKDSIQQLEHLLKGNFLTEFEIGE